MYQEKLAAIRERGYDFDIADILGRAWLMFKKQAINSAAYTMLILSIHLLTFQYLPQASLVVSILLFPPLFSGFYLVANKLNQGLPVHYGHFYGGFAFYTPIVLIWLLGQALTAIGLLLLIIPGIYLMVSYNFAVLMSIFGGMNAWQALEESRKLITGKWLKFFLLTLIFIGLNIAGALLYFLGLIITIPLTFYATYILFEDLTKEAFEG
ncbi:hypothetical protein [Mongoliitalea daihaiensis]|uniref:hypothetical protein n=1 Tax=Mongoliitalea daihaiensis TaxID=2782006 RepID=UPI001F4308DC|nr:hypothetical protein [Mongoliitalea daihaiensis]UJP66873.1 hypothetical protein IPZ59_09910 [Mongoliitalea daihaiensis]